MEPSRIARLQDNRFGIMRKLESVGTAADRRTTIRRLTLEELRDELERKIARTPAQDVSDILVKTRVLVEVTGCAVMRGSVGDVLARSVLSDLELMVSGATGA